MVLHQPTPKPKAATRSSCKLRLGPQHHQTAG